MDFQQLITFRPLPEKLITRWWLVTLLIHVHTEIHLRLEHRRFSNRVNDSRQRATLIVSREQLASLTSRRPDSQEKKHTRIIGANSRVRSMIRLIANLRHGNISRTAMRSRLNIIELLLRETENIETHFIIYSTIPQFQTLKSQVINEIPIEFKSSGFFYEAIYKYC